MAVSSVANSDTLTVTTPSDREIRLTRLFVNRHPKGEAEDLVAELQRS